ncbi:MAG TPA: sulfurtransferase complex subunit TusB [Spirochaetes bacterium]|nr:sulfurtransferase complex subunit TusB [Spirochaetota bacterium]
MLHTVNKSPFSHNNLESCLSFAKEKDAILLYEDGVLGAQAGSRLESTIKAALKKHTICALKEDLNARGISKTVGGIKVIGYPDFVDLVAEHKVIPWL